MSAPPGWTLPARDLGPRLTPLLARDVVGFQQEASDAAAWLEAPNGTVTLIINLGRPFGGLPRAFVAGLADRCALIEQTEAITCLDLKLTPLGGFTLLGVPMGELTGRVVDARDLLGPALDDLLEQLQRTPSWERRFALLDAFLTHRAATGPRPAPVAEWAWRRLLESGGTMPVGRLVEEVGCSPRYLAATFREQIGLGPKMAARVIRFHRLLRRLQADAATPLADAAVAHGYYDQAHLHRDFRRFAGTTPARFRRRPPGPAAPDAAPPPSDSR